MRSREIAERYAAALYAVAHEEGITDAIEAELSAIVEAVRTIPDFDRFFTHPLIPREEKVSLLEEAFPESSEYVRNMIRLLVRNGREAYLDMIYDRFLAVRAEAEGITRVRVIAASPLTEEEKVRLKERLAEALRGPVRIEEIRDESLIAGVRLDVEGKVIDGTLRARLDALRGSLAR